VTRQKSQHSGPKRSAARLSDVLAQQIEPVLFVARFGGCQFEQDLAIGTATPLREIAVHRGLSAFICQMLAPATQI
jgi:hypothetical protein